MKSFSKALQIVLFLLLYFLYFTKHLFFFQVLNVYVPQWESQGRMWPHIHNRVVSALFLAQLTVIGFFAIKKFPYAVLLLPLPIITLVYFFVVQGKFYLSFQVQSLEVASRETETPPPSLEELVKAYTHESLKDPQEIGKEFFQDEDTLLAVAEESKV